MVFNLLSRRHFSTFPDHFTSSMWESRNSLRIYPSWVPGPTRNFASCPRAQDSVEGISCEKSPVKRTRLALLRFRLIPSFSTHPLTDLTSILVTKKLYCLSRGEAVCSVLPPLMTWHQHWDAVGLIGSMVSHKGSSWSSVWTSRCPAYEG